LINPKRRVASLTWSILPMNSQKQTIDLLSDTLPLRFSDQGEGRVFLILHGGTGPASVAGLANELSKTARAIAPTHPGFDGAPRPDQFARVDDLALAYLDLIERLDLSDVVIIGNSIGGWIAAEMALRKSPRIAGIILLNSVGIDTGSPEKTIVDPMKLAPPERLAHAFHDPSRFAAPPSPEAAAMMASNQQTLRIYSGELLHDPSLATRLAQMPVPAMVVWGESDRIVDADYGRRFAGSMPGAGFKLVARAGHFPHLERLDEVAALIGDFGGALPKHSMHAPVYDSPIPN
jgi:pimeloyl-ACP methyl ester carboxylesterase